MSQRAPLSPAAARVKRVVRGAVALIGGVDGAAATVGRGRSTVGRCISLNDPDLPCLDSALAMDEVLVAMGKGAMIAAAMASELQGVFVALPDAPDIRIMHGLLAAQAKESGNIVSYLAEALGDGHVSRTEAEDLIVQVDEGLAVLAAMRAQLGEIAT